jgi:hypothetical protein
VWILIAYFTVICSFGFPVTAHAYVDPGTGSLLLQGAAFVFLIVGMCFRRVKSFISKYVLLNRERNSR